MEQLTLKSHRFRAEREAQWRRLEELLSRLERGSSRKLSDDEVIEIPVLYRAALSSLSVARAVSLDKSLIGYLESLCARAYFTVYGTRTRLVERLARFFAHDWPNAVRALWRETLVSASFMLLGALVAYALTLHSVEWFYAFIPQEIAQARGPDASAHDLHEILFTQHGPNGLTVFSTFLFTHNAQIAIFAFALGFACCFPTALLMIYNGLMLGAFFALHQRQGLAMDFGGWTLIHGVTELFAVTLAGAAGFRIGWALAFPGNMSRLDALAAAGRQAAVVMCGVVVMLAVAGLLEGFGRQLIASTPWRYGIAATTAVIWGSYFYRHPKMQKG